jgi:hypothetical protein
LTILNLLKKAVIVCNKKIQRRPNKPSNNGTDLLRSVEAITLPIAIVQAKSKLDILEKLRFPKILVNIIIAK